jgi:hypothetical protein
MTLLSAVMATKHYVADFLFQTNWMARGKECSRHWLMPLLVHVLWHAGLTLGIALVVAPRLWWFALVDFVIHFTIDRAKGLVCHWGAWTPDDKKFWWLLGLDQYFHQLTNIGLAAGFVLA